METSKKKVAISGASGLIGSRLVQLLSPRYEIIQLVREQSSKANTVYWDWKNEQIELEKLEGIHSLIHLAGEPIVSFRWTEEKKQRILKSREGGTAFLAKTLCELSDKPESFISASAVGYYGDTGEQVADESAESGNSFLAEVCRRWEAASAPAAECGIRVVNPRIGVVLAEQDGALAKMLPVFRMCLGGKLASGQQYMSVISLNDIARAFQFVVESPELKGPVNFVGPESVRNEQFTEALGQTLEKPTPFTVPEFALSLAMGDMADELLLASVRVEPKRLLETGFSFEQRTVREMLTHELSRENQGG